ncbi:MAG TPA: Gfo/Idh/MocA family oxidoreductase [Verrucomicrobiae bacterium]|nr:Gfo/Idh/MocA family oxidoreductase [Verrucomicrobiae bacterium]
MANNESKPSAGEQSRRAFIKTTATAAAAVASTNLLRTPVYGQKTAPSTGKVLGANDRIVVGYIGVGGQGMAHVNAMKRHASANNVAQVAVCDVWEKRRNSSKAFIEKDNSSTQVEIFTDHRKLLERKDIDAVVIATHDTWHTKCAVDAMNAGKHVYVEKPMTRYLAEAFEIADTCKRTGKILQVGSQGCSAMAWHKAGEMIQAGKIGKLVWGQGYYCRNNPTGEWNYTIDPECREDNVDWNRWLGPVKKRVPFNADHYFRWRKYYPYCGGLLGDLMPHRLHPLMLATGKPEFPTRVVSIGSRHVHTDAKYNEKKKPETQVRDVPEHVEILAEFPSGYTMVVVSSTVNARSPGFVIYGHQATLNIGTSGEKIELIPEKEFADEIDPEVLDGLKPTEDVAVHEKNWFDSIRANKQPNAGIDLAVKVQTVISLAEMSERMKITCLFDEKSRKVSTGDGKEVKPITYGTLDLS